MADATNPNAAAQAAKAARLAEVLMQIQARPMTAKQVSAALGLNYKRTCECIQELRQRAPVRVSGYTESGAAIYSYGPGRDAPRSRPGAGEPGCGFNPAPYINAMVACGRGA